jgi:1,2-diacylglycerol 3-beta-glucosyltransferase
MTPLLTMLVLSLGLPVAGGALYLLTVAVASAFYRPRTALAVPVTRLLVLVPAHNEAELVPRCVAALREQLYPRALYRIVVVADNCQDATASLAQSAGAEVMVRDEPGSRGKGQALRWAMDRIFAEAAPPEAIVVVDADAVAEPDFLRELEAEYVAGADLVQANDLILTESGSSRSALEAVALLLRNGVRFAGRSVLGIPATLCGNGMLLSRRILERYPWGAFTTTEDSEYALTLRMAGIRTVFAQPARVYAAATSTESGARTQGVRWDAGRLYAMRRWLPPMLSAIAARRRWDLLGEALDMLVPPFGMLTLTAAGGLTGSLILTAAHVVWPLTVIPWATATVALPVYVVVGLMAAGAPSAYYRSLLVMAPMFLVRKLRIYGRLVKGSDTNQWVRTARPAESGQPPP